MPRHPFSILLHIALAVILAGALVTHFCGVRGSLTLYAGYGYADRFENESDRTAVNLPFAVSLKEVETIYYPGTTTPMDYRSVVVIDDHEISISMNHIGKYQGWRMYQAGIGPDYSTLVVSHDPWGTGITYAGYLLLGIGMVGFFFQKDTLWRALLRHYRKGAALSMLVVVPSLSYAGDSSAPVAMPRHLADRLEQMPVYWNGRICPLQTLARDVTVALYGSGSYAGLSAGQVLSGWLFRYDEWREDYMRSHPSLTSLPPYPVSKKDRKDAGRLGLVEWLGSGEIPRVCPCVTAGGLTDWLPLTGGCPPGVPPGEWRSMLAAWQEIGRCLDDGDDDGVAQALSVLMENQRRCVSEEGVRMPSHRKVMAEIWYNTFVRPGVAGIPAVCVGLLALIFPLCVRLRSVSFVVSASLTAYVAIAMGLLWWISGHVPLSNGPETMLFMALVSLAGASVSSDLTLRGALLTVGGMALMVTAMGGSTPQIGSMMPVLASPLLSVHVMVVMVSYVLFFLMAILSAVGLLTRSQERSRRYSVLNRLILTPAVFMAGAGIFIGAVWANQTWGRYWGWDPKETCALVMWLIYALPLHCGSRRLGFFRQPRVLHIYLLAAILTVLFTYFGANYFLSGLHSYA